MALTVPVDSNSVTGWSFRSGNWSATSLRTRSALMSASSACILIRCSSPSLLLAAIRIEPGAAALKLDLRATKLRGTTMGARIVSPVYQVRHGRRQDRLAGQDQPPE